MSLKRFVAGQLLRSKPTVVKHLTVNSEPAEFLEAINEHQYLKSSDNEPL